jgi:hypothetical protein
MASFAAIEICAQETVKNIHYYMLDRGATKELPAGSYVSGDKKTVSVTGNMLTALADGDCIIYSVSNGEQKEFAHVTVGWQQQNPVLPYSWRMYIPDDEAHNFGGRIYIYGSLDASGVFCSPHYMSLSSGDLRHWESRGYSFSSMDSTVEIPYPGRILWDSDGHFYDGKYWLYGFFEWQPGHENYTFVLESDDPTGPFRNFRWVTGDKSGKPVDGISTEVLTDSDGQLYTAYSPTMNAVEDNYAVIARLKSADVIDEESAVNVGKYLRDFYEAPSLRRRGDTYYLLYAENCGRITDKNHTPKRLSYATAKNIFGPYTYRGIIITVEDLHGNGNIQGSIEHFGDDWYVFYHRALNGKWNNRALCIEKIRFDSDGLIIPAVPTSSGIAENGLDLSCPVYFNTAVYGKNYKPCSDGEYGSILVESNAEIGFRYVNFTGREKSLTFTGKGLDNIVYIKIIANGKIIGERRGNGTVVLKKTPKGKTELTVAVSTVKDVSLEKLTVSTVDEYQ